MNCRPLDTLITFETATLSASAPAPVRYAVRQVLDQEYQKNIIIRENAARQARYKANNPEDDTEVTFEEHKGHHAKELVIGAKKDFFGRLVREEESVEGEGGEGGYSEVRGKKRRK